jgi:hypothetical protein
MKKIDVIDALFLEQKKYIRDLKIKRLLDPPEERKRKSLDDYEYFIKTYFIEDLLDNNGKYIPPAPFHKEMAEQILKSNDKWNGLFEWSRSLAKSSTIAFSILWLMINKKIKFVTYFSNNQNLAFMLLNNIKSKIEASQLFIDDWGPFNRGEQWTKKFFIIGDPYNVAFLGLGAGQNPRGFKYRSQRPDLIIFDDLDDDSRCRNTQLLNETEQWVNQSVIPTGDPHLCKVIMVGNRFSEDMVLTRFKEKKLDYYSKINIINENGKSVWPEMWSEENINKMRETIGEIAFQREYLQNVVSLDTIFKREDIQWGEIPWNKIKSSVIAVDPSWTEGGDTKSIVSLLTDGDHFYVHDIFCRKTDMDTMMDSIAFFYKDLLQKNIKPIIYFESNFGQIYLQKDFTLKEKEWGFKLPIIFDQGKKIEKYMRIENMAVYLQRRLFTFNSDISSNNDTKTAITQMIGFSKKSKMNDDFLDALEYAFSKINIIKPMDPWKYSVINKVSR